MQSHAKMLIIRQRVNLQILAQHSSGLSAPALDSRHRKKLGIAIVTTNNAAYQRR